MTMRVSEEVENPSALLWDGYPFIVSIEHTGGGCAYQGFDDFDAALAKYKRHLHRKAISVIHTLVPSKQVLEA